MEKRRLEGLIGCRSEKITSIFNWVVFAPELQCIAASNQVLSEKKTAVSCENRKKKLINPPNECVFWEIFYLLKFGIIAEYVFAQFRLCCQIAISATSAG